MKITMITSIGKNNNYDYVENYDDDDDDNDDNDNNEDDDDDHDPPGKRPGDPKLMRRWLQWNFCHLPRISSSL